MEEGIQTSNLNAKWLENVYENIKRIEEHERLARNACNTLAEFAQMPQSMREVQSGYIQLQNLKMYTTEFGLLLSDLSPIIPKDNREKYVKLISSVSKMLKEKNLLKEIKNANGKVTRTQLTPVFDLTLELLMVLKVELFYDIRHILYIEGANPW